MVGAVSDRAQPELPPGTLRFLATSLKQQWKRYRKGLKRCQERFSEDAVHESRVETRRLLAILGLLNPFLARGRFQKVETLLKEHLDTFDDLRDTQVQLAAVGKMLRAYPAAAPFYEHLAKRLDRFTRQTRKTVKRIKTKRLAKLIVTCREDVKCWRADTGANEANAMLLDCINHAFARTIQLRRRIDPKDTDTIHRTRVSFKRLRYMIETLADHLPNANDKLLDAMHHYQTMMGEIQDAEVLRRCLDRFLDRESMLASAARRLRRELHARAEFLIQVYLDAADQLLDFWPQPAPRSVRRPRTTTPAARPHGPQPRSSSRTSPRSATA